MELAV